MQGQVLTCWADTCSYNTAEVCCAPGIEVGGDHPACDMYTTKPVQMSEPEPTVGGCNVIDCHFNSAKSCSASGVTFTPHSGHADCVTFRT